MKRTRNGEDFKRTNPEAFEKIAKAMYETKGKVDTQLAQTLAIIPTVTAEDITRICPLGSQSVYNKLWDENQLRGRKLKNVQYNEKFRFCFKDTFVYRYLEKMGIAEKLISRHNLHDSIEGKNILVSMEHRNGDYETSYRGQSKSFRQKQDIWGAGKLMSEFDAIILIPSEIRERVLKDEFLLKLWTSADKGTESIPYYKMESGLSDEKVKELENNYEKVQREKKAKELLMVYHAPEEIKAKIKELFEKSEEEAQKAKAEGRYYSDSHKYNFVPLSDVWYGNRRTEMWKIEKEMELGDFYNSLDYMGLGVVCLSKTNRYQQRNIKNFVTHVNSTVRRFNSDIKKGFDPATVRELVKDDLNSWLSQKVESNWTVFVRDDAPADYPAIQKKKKKAIGKEEVKDINQAILEAQSQSN